MLRRHNVSAMRQDIVAEYDPKPGVSIATLAYDYPPDFNVPEHAHGSDQLIYATHGVMEVVAGRSCWIIPPQFAVWIPARTIHRIRMRGAVSMRTLYLRPRLTPRSKRCRVLHVAPLLRELVVAAVRIGELRTKEPFHTALRDLVVELLRSAPPVPTEVAMPADPRALAVATAFMTDLEAAPSFQALCRQVGVSVRTIERTFRREVGTSFVAWRRQVRLMKAIGLLAAGRSVKEAAYQVGYQQSSAFVEMFRRTLGMTPGAWTDELRAESARHAGEKRRAFSE
jgi:AraC-like DNA-binding protein/mannose-6-phosphate isomerase-like protein (cupin superfamily)